LFFIETDVTVRSPAKKEVTSATKSPENKGKGKEKAVDRSVKEEEEEEEEEDEEDEEDEEEEGDEMEEVRPAS
jgi:hypothetical protein